MKNLYKAALLAALGIGAASAVQAQVVNATYVNGDLLVGLYQSGVNNTVVADIGSYGSLYGGETFNFSTLAASAGITSATDFGAVGFTQASHDILYSTAEASAVKNNTAANVFDPDINTIGANEGVQPITGAGATGFDWYSETINNAAGYLVDSGNSVNETPGDLEALYATTANNSAPVQNSLYLEFNSSTDLLTVVPEPSTYGLLAGAGLLMVAFRKQLRSTKA
jgi:hypothetical protein